MTLFAGIRADLRVGIRAGLNPSDVVTLLPEFVSAGATSSGTGALTPALPAGIAAGDILILQALHTFGTTTDATLSDAQGFAAVTGGSGNSGDFGGIRAHQTLFWRRYDGTGAAPTVADNGDYNLARIRAFRGCAASGDPWDFVTFDGDNDGDTTMTAVCGGTTTDDNRLYVLLVGAFTQATATLSGWANANLANVTELDNVSTALAEDVHLAAITGEKAAAGAIGNTTATWADGTYWVSAAVGIALKP